MFKTTRALLLAAIVGCGTPVGSRSTPTAGPGVSSEGGTAGGADTTVFEPPNDVWTPSDDVEAGDTQGSEDASASDATPQPTDAAETADEGGAADADAGPEGDVWEVPVEDECHFVPSAGVFEPALKCWWGQPDEFTKHDDVVMTPVVANLTDDDKDGDVDLDDIPDIAFLTYRRQEDGCCNVKAVLRVVTGSCADLSTVLGEPTDPKLREHFHVPSPKLDNSGGLALGDVDGDGQIDIVGAKVKGGTVAFTGVRYPATAPSEWKGGGSGFVPLGAADPVAAIATDDGDATVLTAADPGATALLGFEWPGGSAAIAELRIRVRARSVDMATSLRIDLTSASGATAQSVAEPVYAGDSYSDLLFSFDKNPMKGDAQWTDADLDGLTVGLVHDGLVNAVIRVTEVSIVVGQVRVLWDSALPAAADVVAGAQPAIADLDGDGLAEILMGRVVLDGATGDLKWKGKKGAGVNSFLGPISIAANLDLEGGKEVIAGNTVYDTTGAPKWTYDYGNDGTGCNTQNLPCDGFNATGDFDDDLMGEVVTVRTGMVYVWNHDGSLLARLAIPHDNCKFNEGGPPTVADFDADGEPEIGVAGADYYAVFDLECCDKLPNCPAKPAGAAWCDSAGVRWKKPNKDCSSRATGSSVFDFDGDGAAEVVYNDETHFRIFKGDDGEVLFQEPNASHTRLEYPIIVDVDRDGNAEIVFIENGGGSVPIQVWGDSLDNWVATRRIWNQHAYDITSVTESGMIPPGGGDANWLVYNAFRQNLPDFDPLQAPNLTAGFVDADPVDCPASTLLRVEVCNAGELWAVGVQVIFYDADTEQEITCDGGVKMGAGALGAGTCTMAECAWASPPGASGNVRVCVDNSDFGCVGPGWNNECVEDDNADDQAAALCN